MQKLMMDLVIRDSIGHGNPEPRREPAHLIAAQADTQQAAVKATVHLPQFSSAIEGALCRRVLNQIASLESLILSLSSGQGQRV